jgi:hypothetical protein
MSSSPAIVSANTKQSLRQQGCGSGAHSSAVIKFLSVLTKHTGVSCNQQVEPVKDWRSDCLEKQSLLVVELCGVLGRLHSKQGLAQSNNNARSNDSAKHVIKAARNKVQRWSKGRGQRKTQERRTSSSGCAPLGVLRDAPTQGNLRFVSPFFFFFFLENLTN